MDSRIVYHGSSLPPGTGFVGIKRPTLERPLFVSNDVRAAGEYAWVPARGGGRPSMFLVVLKKDPHDAFQFTDEGLDKLKTRLPKVAEALGEYTRKKTFWDWSMEMQYWLENSLKPSKDQLWDTEGSGKGVLETMVELGLVTTRGEDNGSTCPVRLSPELLSAMRMSKRRLSSLKAKEPGLTDPTSVIRRLVKSRIYKVIKDLGYDMVMDGDTTGSHSPSKEIAILDTSAISFGWSVSVDPKDAEKVAKEVDKMLSSKGKLPIGETATENLGESSSISDKMVYHGSWLPPGTPTSELRRPSLKRPFFVTETLPQVKRAYAKPNPGDTTGQASIFVFLLKDGQRSSAFDFRKSSDIDRLKGRLPYTSETIGKYTSTRGGTFYDFSWDMQDLLEMLKYDHKVKRGDRNVPISSFEKVMRHPKRNEEQFKHFGEGYAEKIFIELGLGKIDGDNLVLDDEILEPLFSLDRTSRDQTANIRRAIKSRIYKVLQDMGYSTAIDGDTSGHYIGGSELAIFDMSAIDSGWGVSVSVGEIYEIVKKIEEEQEKA